MILFLVTPFTTEEARGCTTEATKGADETTRNPTSFCFTALIISSFEMNKVNPFLLFQVLFHLLFFQIYLLHLKLNLKLYCLVNQPNYFLEKATERCFTTSLSNLPNQKPRNQPD